MRGAMLLRQDIGVKCGRAGSLMPTPYLRGGQKVISWASLKNS